MPSIETMTGSPRAIPAAVLRALLRVPPLSHAAIRLHTLNVDDANLKTIASLIGTDPALSVLLLRLVNSPLFGVRCRVTGVLQAVALLGLEQLRALEHGMTIQVIETKYRCLGVDTPADLARVEAALRKQARSQSSQPRGKTRRRKK